MLTNAIHSSSTASSLLVSSSLKKNNNISKAGGLLANAIKKLPPEILSEIFKYVPCGDLIKNCDLVSKWFLHQVKGFHRHEYTVLFKAAPEEISYNQIKQRLLMHEYCQYGKKTFAQIKNANDLHRNINLEQAKEFDGFVKAFAQAGFVPDKKYEEMDVNAQKSLQDAYRHREWLKEKNNFLFFMCFIPFEKLNDHFICQKPVSGVMGEEDEEEEKFFSPLCFALQKRRIDLAYAMLTVPINPINLNLNKEGVSDNFSTPLKSLIWLVDELVKLRDCTAQHKIKINTCIKIIKLLLNGHGTEIKDIPSLLIYAVLGVMCKNNDREGVALVVKEMLSSGRMNEKLQFLCKICQLYYTGIDISPILAEMCKNNDKEGVAFVVKEMLLRRGTNEKLQFLSEICDFFYLKGIDISYILAEMCKKNDKEDVALVVKEMISSGRMNANFLSKIWDIFYYGTIDISPIIKSVIENENSAVENNTHSIQADLLDVLIEQGKIEEIEYFIETSEAVNQNKKAIISQSQISRLIQRGYSQKTADKGDPFFKIVNDLLKKGYPTDNINYLILFTLGKPRFDNPQFLSIILHLFKNYMGLRRPRQANTPLDNLKNDGKDKLSMDLLCDIRDPQGNTLMHHAVDKGDVNLLNNLLESFRESNFEEKLVNLKNKKDETLRMRVASFTAAEIQKIGKDSYHKMIETLFNARFSLDSQTALDCVTAAAKAGNSQLCLRISLEYLKNSIENDGFIGAIATPSTLIAFLMFPFILLMQIYNPFTSNQAAQT